MQNTAIEWLGKRGKSWNILKGCNRVSEGCRHCYAERQAYRFSGTGQPYHGLVVRTTVGPQWTGQVEFARHKLYEPMELKKPCRIFVNSMSDLFHEHVPHEWLDLIFAVMALCPQHQFLVLTKRPEKMLHYSERLKRAPEILGANIDPANPQTITKVLHQWPLPNVWFGVSVENQKTADERIPLLLQTPAAIRFISAEPLLGPIDLDLIELGCAYRPLYCCCTTYPCELHPTIDWIIAGGESGPGARPMHPNWARALRDQCIGYKVPFFFKQWGHYAPIAPETGMPLSEVSKFVSVGADGRFSSYVGGGAAGMWKAGKKRAGRVLDGQEWNEWPEVQHEV